VFSAAACVCHRGSRVNELRLELSGTGKPAK
jgi:hypothetical protein